MYNNASYRQFTVSGSGDSYSFSPVGSTVRMQPAIMAWTGATISNSLEPDPGNDGIWFMGYKVTNPTVEFGTTSTRSTTRTSIAPFNLSACLWELE